MTFKVFITRKLPPEGPALLKDAGIEFTEFPHSETPPTKQDIMDGVKGCDGLITLLTDPIDAEVLNASDKLKVVCQYAAGTNNIDTAEAQRLGISVTNTPGVLSETTADLTWALILSAARRIVESDKYTREGKFKGWAPLLHNGIDVYGKTLGIIGAGSIGSAVGRRATGFGMKIIYHNRNRNPQFEEDTGAQLVPLDELIEQADIITTHTPLTPETEYMFGADQFKQMKNSAIFINTARGKCMDEKALIAALRTGEIRAAGLDVFEGEPAISSGLLDLDNVVMVAHIGSSSGETRTNMSEIVCRDLMACLDKKEPRFRVC